MHDGNSKFQITALDGKFKSSAKAELWLIFPGGEGKSYIWHDANSAAGVGGHVSHSDDAANMQQWTDQPRRIYFASLNFFHP